ncbi:MAG: hypothetical protein HKN10_11835 [Myxococcales bacterium]|nr:hypothetical protein [Deltaproteobacteria bacterium]NNE19153.1 hypothetical protein [Myxococcales bacterium]
MAWTARLGRFVICCGILLVSACGDSTDPNAASLETAVTVFVPAGRDVTFDTGSVAQATSMEYRVDCLSDEGPTEANSVTFEGALGRTGAFDGGLKGVTRVFEGVVEIEPGPCTIRLLARDDDGEAVCIIEEPLTIEPGAPSELYFEMPCYLYGCSTTPVPDGYRSSKFCVSGVGVILSAETPAMAENVESLEYALSSSIALVGEYSGSLPFSGPSTADFGAGTVPTDTWRTTIDEVAVGSYLLELTALDLEGETVCAVEKAVDFVAGAVAQIQVALPCVDAMGDAP